MAMGGRHAYGMVVTYLLHDVLVRVHCYPAVRSWLQEDGIAMANELAESMQLCCDFASF